VGLLSSAYSNLAIVMGVIAGFIRPRLGMEFKWLRAFLGICVCALIAAVPFALFSAYVGQIHSEAAGYGFLFAMAFAFVALTQGVFYGVAYYVCYWVAEKAVLSRKAWAQMLVICGVIGIFMLPKIVLVTRAAQKGRAAPGFVGVDGPVYAVAWHPNHQFLLSGSFQHYGGDAAAGTIRLSDDGILDPTFVSPDVRATDLYALPNGRIFAAGVIRREENRSDNKSAALLDTNGAVLARYLGVE
jgi:hypothetical protein